MKIIRMAGKLILAGITAAVILSVIMLCYDIMPVHYENTKGNTDYTWEPNGIWVKMTEGTSWGRFDSDGYNNPKVISDPDIIILGSSHMEATNVYYNQSVGGLLSEKLKDRFSVYNLGMSGHYFTKVCQYLPANLKMYDPAPKVAMLETTTLKITEEKVRQIFNCEVEHTPSQATGLIGTLQKIPVFRSLYHQLKDGLLDVFMQKNTARDLMAEEIEHEEDIPEGEIDEKPYDELFSYLADLEKEYGTQIVIFYQPTETLKESGDIEFQPGDALAVFSKYAETYGIDFVNMISPFEEMYTNDHLVAHGFVTGAIGQGHLNANGHRAIANELFKVVERLEKEGALCQ